MNKKIKKTLLTCILLILITIMVFVNIQYGTTLVSLDVGFVLVPGILFFIYIYIKKITKTKNKTLPQRILAYIILCYLILVMDAIITVGYFQNSLISMSIAYPLGIGFVIYITIFTIRSVHNYQNEVEQSKQSLLNQIEENMEISERLAGSAEELSSSAEEVSSTSENIASTQQQISKGAANQVISITQIQTEFNELSHGIKNIREKVKNISQVSEMMTNIANQTNMLALNAAIEASKAGDAGRGFSVVADQIRKLADEAKSGVLETEKMLKEIQEITRIQEQNSVEIVKSVDIIATVSEETSSSTEESAAAAEEQASSMMAITSTSQELQKLAELLIKKYEN